MVSSIFTRKFCRSFVLDRPTRHLSFWNWAFFQTEILFTHHHPFVLPGLVSIYLTRPVRVVCQSKSPKAARLSWPQVPDTLLDERGWILNFRHRIRIASFETQWTVRYLSNPNMLWFECSSIERQEGCWNSMKFRRYLCYRSDLDYLRTSFFIIQRKRASANIS